MLYDKFTEEMKFDEFQLDKIKLKSVTPNQEWNYTPIITWLISVDVGHRFFTPYPSLTAKNDI